MISLSRTSNWHDYPKKTRNNMNIEMKEKHNY